MLVGRNGLLVWSPMVLVALLGSRRAASCVPSWALQGALAGAAYLLLHAQLNRASGGLAFTYRYPLEPLALAAPFLVASARSYVGDSTRRRRVLTGAVALSIAMQAVVALTLECRDLGDGIATCSLL